MFDIRCVVLFMILSQLKKKRKLLHFHVTLFSKQLNFEPFQASRHWLHDWKKKHNVVSRKITKILSRKDIASLPNVKADVDEYRHEAKKLISKYQYNEVFNTDQSGFNIELLSGRTETFSGEKHVMHR